MSASAVIFMLGSWACVLTLTIWCFARVLGARRHMDPDGIGPANPPVPGRAEGGDGDVRAPR
jgi:hypothetical protein